MAMPSALSLSILLYIQVSPTVALKNTSNNKSDVKLRTVVPLDSATQLTMVENSITKVLERESFPAALKR